MDEPGLWSRVERLRGRRVVRSRPASGGYTTALRCVATFDDGTCAFVKAADQNPMADWIRTEARHYAALSGETFLPEVVAWDDDGVTPLLILEDLSAGHWPPPWTPAQIEAVLEALARVRPAVPRLPEGTPGFETFREELSRWGRVAADPGPFLSLGLCSTGWLERALPTLIAAQDALVLAGSDLLHMDVRSDNLCLRPDGRAALVDWNWACRGNGEMDIAAWLPSLHAEGGPLPETILPDAGPHASSLAGFWAASAGLPPPPTAPRVRTVQRQQVEVALPWAARALDLPPLDGARTCR